MEQTSFELTPEQKGLLATLSRETGKSIPALLAEALDVLQEHERLHRAPHEAASPPPSAPREPSVLEIFHEARTSNGHETIAPAAEKTPRPFWKKALEASRRIPEEELVRLPTDLAVQVDHYIYGTPKR